MELTFPDVVLVTGWALPLYCIIPFIAYCPHGVVGLYCEENESSLFSRLLTSPGRLCTAMPRHTSSSPLTSDYLFISLFRIFWADGCHRQTRSSRLPRGGILVDQLEANSFHDLTIYHERLSPKLTMKWDILFLLC
jgi:hypothetical protein